MNREKLQEILDAVFDTLRVRFAGRPFLLMGIGIVEGLIAGLLPDGGLDKVAEKLPSAPVS